MDFIALIIGCACVLAALAVGAMVGLACLIGRLDDPAREAKADAAGLDLDGRRQTMGTDSETACAGCDYTTVTQLGQKIACRDRGCQARHQEIACHDRDCQAMHARGGA